MEASFKAFGVEEPCIQPDHTASYPCKETVLAFLILPGAYHHCCLRLGVGKLSHAFAYSCVSTSQYFVHGVKFGAGDARVATTFDPISRRIFALSLNLELVARNANTLKHTRGVELCCSYGVLANWFVFAKW